MAVSPGFAPAPPELLSPHPKVWVVGLGEDTDALPKRWAPSQDCSLQGEGSAGLSLLGSWWAWGLVNFWPWVPHT